MLYSPERETGMDTRMEELIVHAEEAMEQKDWSEAIKRWQKVFVKYKDQTPPHAFALLSMAHRFKGNLSKSDSIIRQGLNYYPENKQLLREHAKTGSTTTDSSYNGNHLKNRKIGKSWGHNDQPDMKIHSVNLDTPASTNCLHSNKKTEDFTAFNPKISKSHFEDKHHPTQNPIKSAPLNVIHIASSEAGGAGVAAKRLHSGLSMLGHDSSMLVLKKESNDPKVLLLHAQDNKRSVSLWPTIKSQWKMILQQHPNKTPSLCYFSTPDSIVPIEKYIAEHDIINLHWVAGLVDINRMPQVFSGKKLIWTLHDMNPFTGGCHYTQDCTRYKTGCHHCPQLGPGGTGDIVKQIWEIKNRSYRQLDMTIVTPSRWLGNCSKDSALLSRFPHEVIPYGLDIERFSPIKQVQARKRFGLPENKRIILFGASSVYNFRKGFDLFIDSINRLPHVMEQKNIELVAFGKSSELSQITTPYKLHALGHLNSPEDLSAAYSSADVFVLPTREDNLPNTCLESLACGTPVAGFNIGGLPDMIKHKKTGYIASFPDVQELAEGIKWILAQNRDDLKKACRNRAVKKYSLNIQAQKYIELYQPNNKGCFVTPQQSAANILELVENLLERQKFDKALKIISLAKLEKNSFKNLDYLRALAFSGKNQSAAAYEAVKEELRFFPNNNKAQELLEQLEARIQSDKATVDTNDELESIIAKVKPYTMLGRLRLISLYDLSKKICSMDIPGHFVECGVAAGGSSALLAYVVKNYSQRQRFVYAFDTFEGMPEPTTEDTHAGIPANDTGWGAGTCAAPVSSLMEIASALNVSEIIKPVKGLFKDTLPEYKEEIAEIAFLHMDGDWYESTRDILSNLYPLVSDQGFIQVDDYGHWAGCKKAINEYINSKKLQINLTPIDGTGIWLQKNPTSASQPHNTPALLNLGCGKRFHPEWINVDFTSKDSKVIIHDLRNGIPFASDSFDAVYHSHLLEHLPRATAPYFLKDCYRVLKPGGVIRVAVPDLETIARLYIDRLEKAVAGDENAGKEYEWIILEMFDQMVRNQPGGEMKKYWMQNPMPAKDFVIKRLGSQVKSSLHKVRSTGRDKPTLKKTVCNEISDPLKLSKFRTSGEIHQWMYDRYSLGLMLSQAGFGDIEVCPANVSGIKNFNSYLLDIESDGSIRKPDSLFMEAKKH